MALFEMWSRAEREDAQRESIWLRFLGSGEKVCWAIDSGKKFKVDDGQSVPVSTRPCNVSADKRWLVFAAGSSIGRVDLEYRQNPKVQLKRQLLSLPRPGWHQQQAEIAESAEDWFAATFHRAWALKPSPESQGSKRALQAAYSNLLERDRASDQMNANLFSPVVRAVIDQLQPRHGY